ncbi:hypothetical protein DM01DRAFT_1407600 [Hesseltinella vesiculosa]|uniref:Uncharacterized protein n=1 Tax=Hesseltinella vesiculosa TaxID=101127 RepID=A0A1X2GHR7_9FUNG|nr:hypothetical protein DM01DRAFT_1407600 [Hesseltinella vesiculosa]
MARLNRLIYYLLIILVFVFVSVSVVPIFFRQDASLLSDNPLAPEAYRQDVFIESDSSSSPSTEYTTKYLSWLPQGEFTDQHEAFRNAIRIGKETGRIVIAPMLRIGRPLAWQPFQALATSYKSQDNDSHLRFHCGQLSVPTADPACADVTTDWAEIPWSTLFNLQAITDEFGVTVVERTTGHGWGYDETATAVQETISDVAVVDIMTFAENTTLYRDAHKQAPARKAGQRPQDQTPLTAPLRNTLSPSQWANVRDRQYLQLGALSSTPRYPLPPSKEQMTLRRALTHHLMVTPNQLSPLTRDAYQMIATLGGTNHFSSLRLNLARIVALDARVNKALLDDSATNSSRLTIDDLDPDMQQKVMDAVVLEVFGDIPINQAVSAAMPVPADAPLASLLDSQRHLATHSPTDRKALLDACLDYRRVEPHYPIYYVINDHIASPITRPDIYGPLLKFFPCLFTKDDMKRWGTIDMASWVHLQPQFQDPGVDYVSLLEPFLDILVAGQGYSFFEVPQTPLSRYMGWQRKVAPPISSV